MSFKKGNAEWKKRASVTQAYRELQSKSAYQRWARENHNKEDKNEK